MFKVLALTASVLLCSLMLSNKALAAVPQFTSLTQDDTDKIGREYSAISMWRSVTPPSSLGSIFGFELGVVGGMTKTPEIGGIVRRATSTTDIASLPSAAIVGAITVPMGITIEALYFPKVSTADVSFGLFGGALKWTMTDSALSGLPVHLAARAFYTSSELAFNQTITDMGSPVTANIKYGGTTSGAQLLVSPRFIPVFEPYFGVGYVTAKGTLEAANTVTGTIFSDGTKSKSTSPTSSQILIGLDLRLLIWGFGAEYSRAFGTDSYTGKFSFKF